MSEFQKIFFQNKEDCLEKVKKSEFSQIEIINQPHILIYSGHDFVLSMRDFLINNFPGKNFKASAFCSDDSALAIKAIKIGHDKVIFTGKNIILQKLQEIALKTQGKPVVAGEI